jgi:hypothetical protein
MIGGPVEEAPHIWAPAAIEHAKRRWGSTHVQASRDMEPRDVRSQHQRRQELPHSAVGCRSRPCEEARADSAHDAVLHRAPEGPAALRELYLQTSLWARQTKSPPKARHGIVAMLGREVDCVITHQWENDLNYLYWDVLSLGYPLVHNSSRIKDAGYYYLTSILRKWRRSVT